MGALMGRRKASQPPLELIEAGHIKSLCRRPSALVRTAGSWKPSASTCVCERHHSVFHEDKCGLCTALRIRSTPRNFGSDLAANDSIRKIEAAAPTGRGGTRTDAKRLLSFDAGRLHYHLPLLDVVLKVLGKRLGCATACLTTQLIHSLTHFRHGDDLDDFLVEPRDNLGWCASWRK